MDLKNISEFWKRDGTESSGASNIIDESSDSDEEESYVAIHIKQPFKIMYTDEEGNMFTVDPVSIPDNAYAYRSNVTELHFPVTESVGASAFKGGTLVQTLYIPKLTYAGENAFNGCLLLEKIDAPLLETICDGAFQACASANPINIPKAKLIGNNSFQDCMAVEDICIPNVPQIGDYAFRGCENLKTFRALSLVISGVGAFSECNSLAGIFVPKVYELKNETFKDCQNLRYVSFPTADTIYEDTFANCPNLLYLNLPNVLAAGIPAGAFKGLDRLQYLNISREVSTAMATDDYLENLGIDIDKCHVNVICKGGTKNRSSSGEWKNERLKYSTGGWIVGINPPKEDTSMPDFIQSQTEVSEDEKNKLDPNLDDGYAIGIDKEVFMGRTELQSVVMTKLSSGIGEKAFYGCSELAFAAFPKLKTPNIVSNAFKGCPKLLNVCLPGMTRQTVWNNAGSWGLPASCVVECSDGYVVIPNQVSTGS